MEPSAVEFAIAAVLELAPDGFVEDDGALVVYADEQQLRRLQERFGELHVEPVAPGWEDEWRRFHVPVEIGPLWIGPPWRSPPAALIPVVIDPGRAFGTGAHETTRLCLELILTCERGSFLDAGSGSGVLAIAAAKLGFHPVVAADVDQAAVEATRSNAAANGVELDIRLADAREVELPEADVAVANVSLEAVEAVAPRLAATCLITSGYLVADAPRPAGYRHLDRRTAERFAADLYVRE